MGLSPGSRAPAREASRSGTPKASIARARRTEGPAPDTISHNTVISTAARLGEWRRSLAILDEMEAAVDERRRGAGASGTGDADVVSPDVYTYTATISACERGGEVSAALETFHRMQARGISPNTAAYNAAVRAAATRELWPLSLSLLADMRSDRVPMDLLDGKVDRERPRLDSGSA